MASDVVGPPSVFRRATVTALVTSLLAASGVTFTINKLTPTAAIRNEVVEVVRSSSGTGLKLDGWGNLTVSGAIISDGVQLSTGALLNQSIADNRYVNTSGDTMTGSLTVHRTMSGTSLTAKSMTGTDIYAVNSLNSSGSVAWEGNASGSTLSGLGLSDCDAANQCVNWDVTTKKFACVSISTGGATLLDSKLVASSQVGSSSTTEDVVYTYALSGSVLAAGDMIKIHISGGDARLAAGVVTMRLRLGATSSGTVLATIGAQDAIDLEPVSPFSLDGYVTFRSVGAGGTAAGELRYQGTDTSDIDDSAVGSSTSDIAVNTTGSVRFTVTIHFTSSNASNYMTYEQANTIKYSL